MESPTPEQVRALRKAANLTQAETAKLLHSSRRAVQGWEADASLDSARAMHPGLWELLIFKVSAFTHPAAMHNAIHHPDKKMPAQEAG